MPRRLLAWGNNVARALDPTSEEPLLPAPVDITKATGCDEVVFHSWACTIGRGERRATDLSGPIADEVRQDERQALCLGHPSAHPRWNHLLARHADAAQGARRGPTSRLPNARWYNSRSGWEELKPYMSRRGDDRAGRYLHISRWANLLFTVVTDEQMASDCSTLILSQICSRQPLVHLWHTRSFPSPISSSTLQNPAPLCSRGASCRCFSKYTRSRVTSHVRLAWRS
jgi:hypothetical protein